MLLILLDIITLVFAFVYYSIIIIVQSNPENVEKDKFDHLF